MAKYSQHIAYNISTTLDSSGLNKLQAQLRQVESEFAKLSAINPGFSDVSLGQMKRQLDSLSSALTSSFNASLGTLDLKTFSKRITESSVDAEKLKSIFAATGTIGQQAFNSLAATLGKVDTNMRTVSTTTEKIMNTLGNTVRWGLIASAFQTIMNGAHDAAQYVKDLDKSLNDIRIVSDYNAQEMREFSLYANDAAKALGQTTVAYTNASLIFAQQGYDLDTSNQMAELTLKVANTTGQETAEVSEQITAWTNGYQMSLDQLGTTLDKVTKVAATSAADTEELMTAASRVAATASTLGVTEDQLIAQMATIISVTREAPENVGNALKTIYARMGDLSLGETLEDGVNLGQVSGTLQKIGVDVLDTSGKMRDMGDIIEDLMAKWNTLDQGEKQAAAVKLAGKYQYNRLMTLMENQDMYNQYLADSAQGAEEEFLDKTQAIYMESWEAKAQQMSAAFEGLISDMFNPDDFKPLMEAITNVIDLLDNMIEAIGGGGTALIGLGAIATRVFNNQIASGINNIIGNQAVKKMQQSNMSQTQIALGLINPGGELADNSKTYQFASNMQPYMRSLSTKEQEAYNTALNTTLQLENTSLELEKKINQQLNQQQLNGLKIIDNKEKIAQLDRVSTNLEKIRQQGFEAQTAINAGVFDDDVRENALKNMGKALQELKQSSAIAQTDLGELIAKYQQLQNEASKDPMVFQRGFQGLLDSLEKAGVNVENLKADLISLRNMNETTSLQEDVNQAMEQQAATKQRISDIVTLTGAVSQYVFAMQAVGNLPSIINDEDITNSEKFNQIVLNIAMTAPMLVTAMEGINNVFGGTGIKKAINSWKEYQSIQRQIQLGQITAEQGQRAVNTAMQNGTIVAKTFGGTIKAALASFAPLLAITVGLTALTAAFSNIMEEAERVRETQKENIEKATSGYETSKKAVTDLAELKKSYDNGEITQDEFKASLIEVGDALDDVGAKAVAAAGDYDKLSQAANRLTTENHQELLSSLRTQKATYLTDLAGGFLTGNTLFNGSIQDDFADAIYNNYVPENDFQNTLGRMSEDLAERANELYTTSSKDYIGYINVIKAAVAEAEQEIARLTDEGYEKNKESIQIRQNDVKALQKFLNYEDVQGYQQNLLDTAAALAPTLQKQIDMSQISDADELFEKYLSNQEFAESLRAFGEERYSQLEGLASLITDQDQALMLTQEAVYEKMRDSLSKISNLDDIFKADRDKYGDIFSKIFPTDINNVEAYAEQLVKQIKNSAMLSDEDKIQLGDLIGKITPENAEDIVNQIVDAVQNGLDNKPVEIQFDAKVDVSSIESAVQQKQNLNELVSSYQKNGSFTEDEMASILVEHPDYVQYLSKVGDLYYLNQQALLDWNQAVQDQHDKIETLYGRQVDLTEQTEKLSAAYRSMQQEQSPYKDVLEQVMALNHEMTLGNLSNGEFLDGLNNAFESLEQTIKSCGDSFDSFLQNANNAQFTSALTEEFTQGLKQATKQFKSGEQNISDYARTMLKAGKNALTLEKAQSKLDRRFADQIEDTAKAGKNLNELGDNYKKLSKEEKESADRIADVARSMSELEAAADFSQYLTDNFAQVDVVFDDFFNVVENVRTATGGIKEEFRGLISGLAEEMANVASSSAVGMQSLADVIHQFGYDVDRTAQDLATDSAWLRETMMADADFASQATLATAGTTQAAIQQMANGISAIISAVSASIASINSTVNTDVSWENDTKPITGTLDGETVASGEISMPKPTLKIQGSGGGESGTGGENVTRTGNTRRNATTGEYETEITHGHYQSNDEGANPGMVSGQMSETSWVSATTDEIIQYGATQLATGLAGILGNNAGARKSDYAPSGSGGTVPASNFSNPYGSSGGSGGGGGGGGSGSSPKEETEKAVDPKYIEDLDKEVDLYEKVNAHLERLASEYDIVASARERVIGYDMIGMMNKEIDLLKQQIGWQKAKLEIQQKEDAIMQRQRLAEFGIKFDEEGYITNYGAIWSKLSKETAAAATKFNYSQNEADEEAYNKLKERFDKFEDYISSYDSLQAEIVDTRKEIEDLEDSIEDVRIEAFETAVEAAENIKDIQENLIDFNAIFSGLQSDNPFREMASSAEKLGKYFDVATESAASYYDTLIAKSRETLKDKNLTSGYRKYLEEQIQLMQQAKQAAGNMTLEEYGTGYLDMEMKNLSSILDEIRQFEQTGTSRIFGEDSADMYEVAQDIFDNASSMLMDFEGQIDDLRDAILDAIDDIAERMEERLDQYEAITEELEHQASIIELLRGETAYDELNKALAAQQANYKAEMNELSQQLEIWKDLQSAMVEGSEEWKTIQEEIVDTQAELNELIQTSLENLQQQYENMINKVLDSWVNSAIGTDLEWMESQWELINRNADYYLDSTNAAYNIQKLQGKYLELLDGTHDLHIQQQITQQMQEQLAYLREKEKISEYDVAYAEAQLQILQKRIALEEAQRNKSQMKLRRDAQGNYSYVYTANKDNTNQAEQDLLDAQNNAYNLSKEQMKQTQEDSLSALQDAKNMLNQIWTDANLSLEEKTKRTQTILDSLREYIEGTSEQLSTSELNIINDFIGMVELMTDENNERLQEVYQQILDGNKDAFDQIDTRWATSLTQWLQNMEDFNLSTESMFESLVDYGNQFQQNIDEIGELVGQDFNDMSDAIQNTIDKTNELASSTASFIGQLKSDAGVVKEYEKTMQDYADRIADANNQMKAYKEQVNELATKLTGKEQTNASLSELIKSTNDARYAYTGSSGYAGSGVVGGVGVSTANSSALSSGSGSGSGNPTDANAGDVVGFNGNYYYDSWGTSPSGNKYAGQSGKVRISSYSGGSYGYQTNTGSYLVHIEDLNGNPLGWVSPSQLFDTGGYTGEWSDGNPDAKNGKMAWLHEKELVLNAADTENILAAVQAVRDITQAIKGSALTDMISTLGNMKMPSFNDQEIEQNVHIDATFPNVKDATEIEQALLTLTDTAVQYAFNPNN